MEVLAVTPNGRNDIFAIEGALNTLALGETPREITVELQTEGCGLS
jgi:hypothetical protein